MVADIWLSKVVLDLIEKSSSVITAGETVSLVVESVSYVFTRLYMKTAIIALGGHVQTVGIVHHAANPNPDVNESPLADPEARGRGPLVQANS